MRDDFIPKKIEIQHISRRKKALVKTKIDHGYSTGQVVCISVPPEYGMFIPDIFTKIEVVSDCVFSCDYINTEGSAAFEKPTDPDLD